MFQNFKYRRYLIGQGRATRSEYWTVVFGATLVCAAVTVAVVLLSAFASSLIEVVFGEIPRDSWLIYPQFAFWIILFLFFVALFILQIWLIVAVSVRRLHDCDFPGWPAVLIFVPYLGACAQIIFGFWFPHEPNRHGDDPRQFRKAYDA